MCTTLQRQLLLKGKNAVIYGAGGAVGGAVARAFARAGAKVFLTGRNLGPVEIVAAAIAAEDGVAEVAQVDALDEQAVETHASAMADWAGGIDVSFNAIGIPQQGIQGIPLSTLPVESFARLTQRRTRAADVAAVEADSCLQQLI
jgi:NAD(P)-dependent dehydrogenase (short-subunit alcohol dehydrogenase family)